jgi:hypothetical protein
MAIIVLPAIFSMVVKCLSLRMFPPRITIGLSILCICLNFGLMGIQISTLNQSCLFGGSIDSDPFNSFPTILVAGIIVYFLFLPVFATVQFVQRFAKWRRNMFIISILTQIAAIIVTVGFISLIELGVRRAQPFLVGGSEDTWGFGQILVISVLILPTVERLEYGFSRSKEDPSKSKLGYWRDVQLERIRKGSCPDVRILMTKSSIDDYKVQRARSGSWGRRTRRRYGYRVISHALLSMCSLVSSPSCKYDSPKRLMPFPSRLSPMIALLMSHESSIPFSTSSQSNISFARVSKACTNFSAT